MSISASDRARSNTCADSATASVVRPSAPSGTILRRPFGKTKTRMLEFVLGRALAIDADTVVGGLAVQSTTAASSRPRARDSACPVTSCWDASGRP